MTDGKPYSGLTQWITTNQASQSHYWIEDPVVTSHGENEMAVQAQPAAPPEGPVPGVAPGEAKLHIDPVKATIQIRTLVKAMWEQAVNGTLAIAPASKITARLADLAEHLYYLRANHEGSITYRVQTEKYLAQLDKQLGEINDNVRSNAMRERVAQARGLASNVRSSLVNVQSKQETTLAYLTRAEKTTNTIKALAKESPSAASTGLQAQLASLHELVQALPTFEGALMSPAENVLHAITVMLKNNGYLKGGS